MDGERCLDCGRGATATSHFCQDCKDRRKQRPLPPTPVEAAKVTEKRLNKRAKVYRPKKVK